MPFRYVIVVK